MAAETYAYGDNAYATKELVQGHGSEFSFPTGWSDDEINVEILRASKTIDLVTGKHFGYSLMTLLLDGNKTATLFTSAALSWRIVNISSVKKREDYGDAFDETIDATDYTMGRSRKSIIRTDGDVWEKGIKNYQVVGRFGMRHVPEPIKIACILLARYQIDPKSVSKFEKYISENFGDGYSYTRESSKKNAVASAPRSTGVLVVDNILANYISSKPLFAIPGS